jgi:hypothetical protein
MNRLGYARYVAQGGDIGASVTDAMGRLAPDGLAGIHLNFLPAFPTDVLAAIFAGGFGSWRDAIGTVEALGARHIVAGHQNHKLDDDARRTIAETRQYLDDADELLRTENSAVGFFNAKIERYPDHLARTVLWAGASAIYGVREHPGGDVGQILVAGRL